MSNPEKEYALYKGDKLLAIGTAKNLADLYQENERCEGEGIS